MWPINFSLQIESLTITILRASWRKHVFDKGKYLVPAAMASIKSMYHVSVSSLKWMTEQFFTCFTLFRLFFFELFRVCAKADQGQIGPGPHINGLSLRQKVTNKINLEAATSAREERNTSMSTFIFAVKMQLIKKKVFFGNGRVDNKWVPWVHVSRTAKTKIPIESKALLVKYSHDTKSLASANFFQSIVALITTIVAVNSTVNRCHNYYPQRNTYLVWPEANNKTTLFFELMPCALRALTVI